MVKIIKILGLVAAVIAIPTVALTATVSAADGNLAQSNQTQNLGEITPCGDCVCGDCEPNDYSYYYSSPGPHGTQNNILDAETTGNPDRGTQTQNQGEITPCENCELNDYSYSYNYSEPGPHGAQNGILDTETIGNSDQGTQIQNQGEECICENCEPNDYSNNNNYLEPGPHGAQSGQDSETVSTDDVNTDQGNQGEDCPGTGTGPKGPAPNSGDGIPDGSGF